MNNLKKVMEKQLLLMKNCGIKFSPKQKIVDIGSGAGDFVGYMNEEKYDTYGVDLEKMLSVAKKGYPKFNKKFLKGAGSKIPFEDNSIDILRYAQSFHHIEDLEKGIDEITRVLKVGGFAFIIEPVFSNDEKNIGFFLQFKKPEDPFGTGKVVNTQKFHLDVCPHVEKLLSNEEALKNKGLDLIFAKTFVKPITVQEFIEGMEIMMKKPVENEFKDNMLNHAKKIKIEKFEQISRVHIFEKIK